MSVKHWFLPDDTDLIAMLRAQAELTCAGMRALVAWSDGQPDAATQVRAIEHQADDAKRELWRTLREAFSPPMDAEDLFTLSADLDEVLNAAKDLVREMEVMGLEPDAPMHEMASELSDAVEHLNGAFDHLRDGTATDLADAAIKSQRRVEHVYRAAMSTLLAESDVAVLTGRREAYRRLSRIGDLVHRVAERIWYSVVKEA